MTNTAGNMSQLIKMFTDSSREQVPAPVSGLARMLRDFDQIRKEHSILSEHGIVDLDEHVKNSYATQLAAILLAETVSDTQSLLLGLLVKSMSFDKEVSELLEQAQNTNKQQLQEFLRIVTEHRLAHVFVLDALILLRVASPLTIDASQLLSELTALIDLRAEDVAIISSLAAKVLALPQDVKIPNNYDYIHYKLQAWQEFFYVQLTTEILEEGISTGYWLVDSELIFSNEFGLDDDFNFENIPAFINDAYFRFTDSGQLIFKSECIKIQNSIFINPRLKITGKNDDSVALFFNNKFNGSYSKEKNITAVEFESCSFILKDCFFNTINARAINVSQSSLVVDKNNFYSISSSFFEGCGNSSLDGGAISIDTNIGQLVVSGTEFKDCIAKKSGAVHIAKQLEAATLNNTVFSNCLSLQDIVKVDGEDNKRTAVNVYFIPKEFNVSECKFVNSNLKYNYIECSGIKNNLFIDSIVFIYDNDDFGDDIESALRNNTFESSVSGHTTAGVYDINSTTNESWYYIK